MCESRYVAWTSTGVSVCFISYLLYDKFFKKKNDYVTESERNAEKLTKKEVLELRRKFFCDAQSISYENSNPLFATKAKGQYIYDSDGTEYLDTRNNVGHVGWQNPIVLSAIQRQLSKVNSNSRYIHNFRVLLAKKLTETMPKKLCRVFFVNSGSEANDLAIRLATTHTGKQDMIVVDHAYHGHTVATLEVSPYKYEHAGGSGKASHIHKVPCPDTYRGLYRGVNAAIKYADHVKRACDEVVKQRSNVEGGVAAFFVESGMSVGGVIIPPKGYLRNCYQHVHKCGGICIADEVQVGFGRFGEVYWGFELDGVIPDIVTIGKPFGNGFPLAAVVTTNEISKSFANGLEYFNTFGGNPVACAAGIAVMDVIETGKMQRHASKVGSFLKEKLLALSKKEVGNKIGNVRGKGLFLGIEFVNDRQTLEPATKLTSLLCSRLKDRQNILTSIDGPHNNVIVIKPPLCFSQDNARYLVKKIEFELQSITDADIIDNFTHTAT